MTHSMPPSFARCDGMLYFVRPKPCPERGQCLRYLATIPADWETEICETPMAQPGYNCPDFVDATINFESGRQV